MFTGIISNIATVLRHTPTGEGLTLTFERPKDFGDLVLGESVATDGACLTVSALRDGEYDCYLMGETLDKTMFGGKIPARVNLERAMSASARFGGHFVQGHVDGVGRVAEVRKQDGYVIAIEFAPEDRGLVMHKGSICLNGVSLTVSKVSGHVLEVSLIPHTLEHTTLGVLEAGDQVNLEFDMVGKYIANIMEIRKEDAES